MQTRCAQLGVTAAITVALASCSPAPLDPIVLDPHSPTSSLIGYWSFDDGPGSTTVKDRSVLGHNGIVVGGHTWITHAGFGGALTFDGTGEIDIPAFPQPGPQSWSVTAWVRTDPSTDTGTSYAAIVSNEWLRTGGWELNLQYGNPTLYPNQDKVYQFAYWLGSVDINGYTHWDCKCVSTTDWTHVAAVLDRDAKTLFFYRNGDLDGSVPAMEDPPIIRDGDPTLFMARWPPRSTQIAMSLGLLPEERRFIGSIDDVAIYNRALNRNEVAELAKKPVLPAP